jgi:hypothetical protein
MDIEFMIAPNYALIGVSWFNKDEEITYSEINIHFLCFKLSFYWE